MSIPDKAMIAPVQNPVRLSWKNRIAPHLVLYGNGHWLSGVHFHAFPYIISSRSFSSARRSRRETWT